MMSESDSLDDVLRILLKYTFNTTLSSECILNLTRMSVKQMKKKVYCIN